MLKQIETNDRSRARTIRVSRVSELEVRRAADQLLKRYPETSWLVAAERSDSAFAAGQMLNFRLWRRVADQL